MIVSCDIGVTTDWWPGCSSTGEDIIWVIIIIIVIVTPSLVVIDTAQSDEQACDFQNWPMIISNTIWDNHEQNARSQIWSPMNCLGIYLCTVWDEYCAIGIGCRVY